MNAKVSYDIWQMECCGVPFKIGDSVVWYVVKAENEPSVEIEGLDYYYDAHSDDIDNLYILNGIVKNISIQYIKYELEKGEHHNRLVPVLNTSKFIKTDSSDIKDENIGELKASSFLVELTDVEIRPAKKL